MASPDLADLTPETRNAYDQLVAKAQAKGITLTTNSAFRTYEDQRQLYANYQAGRAGQPLPYPDRGPVALAARPGYSPHEFGVAFDVSPHGGSLAELNAMAPGLGLTTVAGDPGHFQLAGWHGGQAAPDVPATQTADAPGTTINTTGPSRPVTPTPGPTLFAGVNPDARGMRNNNPGNLISSSKWVQGLPGYKGSDGKFAIFDTPQHGAAALDANLANYASKGINTPFGVASTWAPASDNNNPNSYGAQIAKGLGVGLNDKIDLTDPTIRSKIANSIALVENGPGKSTGVQVAYAGSGGAGTPATPATPATPTPSVGNAIASLTQQAGDNDLAKTMTQQPKPQGGGGPDQGQAMQMQQMASAGNPRQQLIQMQAQQLAAQLQQRAQQPLSWGTAPYGSGAGLVSTVPMAGQMPPGVTLNSMGGQYV